MRVIRAYEKSGFIRTKTKKYPKNKYLPKVFVMELVEPFVKPDN